MPQVAIRTAILVLTLLALSSECLHAQDTLHTSPNVIQGTVTSDSSRAVSGAEVIVTMAPDRRFKRTLTDSLGRYRIAFEHGTGDYLVHAAAKGMNSFRKRVTGPPADSVFVVNIALTRVAARQLAAVTIVARRPKPRRGGDKGTLPGPGADERVAGGLHGILEPDLAGNLAAIAGTVPGIAVTPQGVSVAGLNPDQNSTTLEGLAFPGAVIPRDALTSVRVSTSTYDPSRGWFGGVQENLDLESGVVASLKHVHLTLDAPALQYTDPVSARLGQRFTNVQASLGAQDRMHLNRLEYNYGAQVGRRVSDVASLATAPAAVLQRAGIAPDSATRVLAALSAAGVPTVASGAQVTENASFIGQIGAAPDDWITFQPVRSIWQLLGYGSVSRITSAGIGPASAPGYTATRGEQQFALQLHLSSYVRGDYLVDGRSAVSVLHTSENPALALPAGHVLVASDLGAGQSGVSSIGFGGYDLLPADRTQWTWETHGQLRFYRAQAIRHRIKLTADSRFDGVDQRARAGELGVFTFQSPSDIALGQPASFTRVLGAPTESASEWNGFVALGDWWRPTDNFQLLYGARLEANRFLRSPAYNPAIGNAFGLRTDHLPNTISLSPRIGFTWSWRGDPGGGYANTKLGEFPRLPPAYILGGIGEFRGLLSPQLAADAFGMTGLANGIAQLTCLGAAVPTPAWGAYLAGQTAVPAACASGYAQSPLSDAAPVVALFAPGYTAPRSWRANLAYSSTLGRLTYTLDGVVSLNLDQPGRTDVNFAGVPRFTTADEGRPVFVTPSSIVARSGLVATNDARVAPSFGRVFDNESSLRSISRQVTLSLTPDLDALGRLFGSLSYTLASTRALASGFDGPTFGSPLGREWARGNFDIRHQLLIQGGIMRKGIRLTLFGRLQSGIPYTPLVGGDVNGDGLLNDRAFVFEPATALDSAVGAGMRALLAPSQGVTRGCLARQLGRAAGRNSCEGPWTASLNAQVAYTGALPLLHHTGTIVLALINPLGGLDRLVHGSRNLHGWGTPALPNPILYNVRGFDPSGERFLYQVNPRFGDTRPAATTVTAPFRVTLDIAVDLSAPQLQQFVERWVKPGRGGYPGPRLPARVIRRSYDRVTPDPFTGIMELSDSLMLSVDQIRSLMEADRDYRAARDPAFDSLATYLAGLGDRYSVAEAMRRQRAALDTVWEAGHVAIRRTLPRVLTRIQRRMLPYPASLLYATPDDIKGLKILAR